MLRNNPEGKETENGLEILKKKDYKKAAAAAFCKQNIRLKKNPGCSNIKTKTKSLNQIIWQ